MILITTTTLLIMLGIIAMAFIGLIIGKSKERGCAGFFLGLLLGPIGWIIVACLSDDRPRCPECLGIVNDYAKKCQNCGTELPLKAEPLP